MLWVRHLIPGPSLDFTCGEGSHHIHVARVGTTSSVIVDESWEGVHAPGYIYIYILFYPSDQVFSPASWGPVDMQRGRSL